MGIDCIATFSADVVQHVYLLLLHGAQRWRGIRRHFLHAFAGAAAGLRNRNARNLASGRRMVLPRGQ